MGEHKMAGRPTQKKADIQAIQDLYQSTDTYSNLVQTTMIKPIIIFTMRKCGCTFQEIGDVFGITRQMAETAFKNAEQEL